ncbi:MAG: efflux RND transporter permease subunit, partial [Burkholderiaceae bacterium]|nr:efflux RND transporter permease subunit [Burkholderiaceae bacterium]
FIVENIGMPDPVNMGWVDSYAVGSYDGEIQIQLKAAHRSTILYEQAIRRMMKEQFPGATFFAQPADITSLTLAGATPTALDVRFAGKDVAGNIQLAREFSEKMKKVNGAVDVGVQQVFDLPEYYIAIDRVRALQLGVTLQDAQNTILAALGSAGTVSTNYWVDLQNGYSYTVQVQTPIQLMDNISTIMNLRVPSATAEGGKVPLGSIATVSPRKVPANIGRVTLMPVVNVLVNTEDTDVGSAYDAAEKHLQELRPRQKAGNSARILGQADAMHHAYKDLLFGFVLALFLIYVIMLFNFASWILPLVALSGAPVALTGAALALWATGTTISVPSLMGFIMVIGVSTANSVLVTSFARDLWMNGTPAAEAGRRAAVARLRPVLMTALTMIIGVIPMALATGQGGEQNAPLARAIIGGLALGTGASLVLVPTLFGVIMQYLKPPVHDMVAETT